MVKGNSRAQDFSVSVDHKSTTTGISVFERAQTIKALADKNVDPDDFQKPGHIFPLISKNNGVLEKIEVAEVATDLAEFCSYTPMAYVSEILNEQGELADESEINNITAYYSFQNIRYTDILNMRSNQLITSVPATIKQGNHLDNKVGFQ